VAFNPFNSSPEALANELTKKSAEGWEVVDIVTTFDGRYCAFLRRPISGSTSQPTSSVAAPAATTAGAPAAWYADPSGRFGQQFTDPPARVARRGGKGRAGGKDRCGQIYLTGRSQHPDPVVDIAAIAQHAGAGVKPLRRRILSVHKTQPREEHRAGWRGNIQQLPGRLGGAAGPQQGVHPRIVVSRGQHIGEPRRKRRFADVAHGSAAPHGSAKLDRVRSAEREQGQRLPRAGSVGDGRVAIEEGGDPFGLGIFPVQRTLRIAAQLGLFRETGIAQQEAGLPGLPAAKQMSCGPCWTFLAKAPYQALNNAGLPAGRQHLVLWARKKGEVHVLRLDSGSDYPVHHRFGG